MKKILLLLALIFIKNFSFGQTSIISPTGDGGFENGTTFAANGWTLVNHSNHLWTIGGGAGIYAGSRSAYISQDGGTSNTYNISLSQTSHFYRDVTIPAGSTDITLSFYIKGSGEAGWDRLLVYTAPTSVTPVAGFPTSSSFLVTGATLIYTQSAFFSGYTLVTITLPSTLAGTTFRLIFTWQNDTSIGTQPAVAVDNIALGYNPNTAIITSVSYLNFDAVTPSTCSPAQTFTVTGSGLTGAPGNLTATAPANYQLSFDGGSTWVTSGNIPYTSATLGASSVMARFCPPAVGAYCGGNITITGGGAATANIALCGYGATTCSGTPTAGTATITPTSGSGAATFTLGLSGSTIATGLTYQWQNSASGGTGTYTNISGATNQNYVFSGISANTYYQCNVTCPTYATATSGTVMATYVAPTYCAPTYSVSCSVMSMPCSIASLTGVSGSITDPSTSCGLTGPNYTDNYATMSVTLLQGASYTANIGGNAYGSNYAVQVWIDFNDDGVFSSTETLSGGPLPSTATSGANPMTLTIPASATPGTRRMRIVGNYYACCGGSNYPSISPCITSSVQYGETRDYKVIIQSNCPTPITGTFTVCPSSTTTLSSTPSGGAWVSSNMSVATVSTGGVVTGVTAGTSVISYTKNSCTVARVVTVETFVGSVTGAATICAGSTTTLSASVSGGTWSSSNVAVGTVSSGGIVMAITGGTTTISYTRTTSCGTAVATRVITVNPLPAPGTISGASSVCTGSNITLTCSGTGGTWSSAAPTTATVGSTGIVTGATTGVTTISYTVSNGCGIAAATKSITVNPVPNAGIISGTASICVSGSTTLSTTGSGGVWSSAAPGIATVGISGIITGVSTGTVTISYTATNSCGTAVATKNVTVSALPSAGSITGASSVCVGNTIALSNTASGGSWISSNTSIATVGATGIVTGILNGTVTISYTVTNSCGTANATKSITVNPLPNAGSITGASTLCTASTTTLSNTATGGTWSSSSSGVATVGSTGIVTGVSTGVTTISYTVSNGCGTLAATKNVTVSASAVAGTISGASSVCVSGNITLSTTGSGGVWSSSNSSIATVGTTGIVSGISGGTVTISYTVTGSCGTALATKSVTVSTSPGAGSITGTTGICVAGTTTLSNTATGGTWSSASPTIAIISATGIVTGITVGTATISYTKTNICGIVAATVNVTVNTTPYAGTITGPSNVCATSTIALSNATTGGTWNSSNTTVAIVGSTGIVTGLTGGTAVIEYIVTNSCGNGIATKSITVTPLPSGTSISGPSVLCAGTTTVLTSSGPSGTWTSSNASIATVGSTGIVTGVSAGVAIITYTATNICGSAIATKSMTVNPIPVTITGTFSICSGTTTTLSNSVTGGTWSSSATSIATINATTGVLSGISAGTTRITYTLTGGCYTTIIQTINASTTIGSISGASTMCTGTIQTLTNTTTGGTWSSSNTTIASVGSTGIVFGISAGTVVISYILAGGSCPGIATKTITVNLFPSAGTITGPSGVCIGSTITLSSTVPGGTWGTSSPGIATVNSTGIVTGMSSGVVTISYRKTSSCGISTALASVTVSPTPYAGTITGASTLCSGDNTTLICSGSGGTWSSSNTAAATVGSSGIATGISGGVAIISYVAANSCGTGVATKSVTVSTTPGAITGTLLLCDGSTTTLTNPVTGGTWSSGSTSVATINMSTGLVAAISAGTADITYTTGIGCIAAIQVTVTSALTGSISGATYVCVGSSTTFTHPAPGGVWTSSDVSLATVNPTTGDVTGVSTGTATITYSVGSCYKTRNISVSTPASGAISGNTNVCLGSTSVLSYPTSGSSWSSSDPSVATIGATSGLVTGISIGTALISYMGTTGCGTSVTVNVLPLPTPITGTTTLCQTTSTTLSSLLTLGGTWTSDNVGIATIGSSTGDVYGVNVGTANITYTWTNSCIRKILVSVNPMPGAGAIVGPGIITVGTSAVLSPSTPGGIWYNASPAFATLSLLGGSNCSLTGIAVGSVVVSYIYTNSCGTATVSRIFNIVSPRPGVQEVGAGAGGSLFNVFPNPTSGEVTIEAPVSGKFSVYTIDGRLVQQYEIKEQTTNITLSNKLAAGVYMCRFNGDDGSTVMVRLVVER